MTWINVGCGTHRAPTPWINLDSHRGPTVDPDILVEPGAPLPFDDDSCERVLLSHVLEHVPWEDVPGFLAEVRRVCAGEVLVVGPDAYRTVQAYRTGGVHWSLVTSVLEHKDFPDDMAGWPGAPHHWNCHEDRVRKTLERCGFTVSGVTDAQLRDWPLVGWSAVWQFALRAHRA